MRITSVALAASALLSLAVGGCRGRTAEAPPAQSPAGAATGAAASASSGAPSPSATPVVPAAAVTSRPCDATETLALSSMLEGRAKADARGMSPAGATVCTVLPEGQSASSTSIVLQPDQCYTALAQALPGVAEVDVELVLDPSGAGALAPFLAPAAGTLLATDTQTGVAGGFGVGKDCFTNFGPLPVPAKLVVKSRVGAGPAVAQLYSKKK